MDQNTFKNILGQVDLKVMARGTATDEKEHKLLKLIAELARAGTALEERVKALEKGS